MTEKKQIAVRTYKPEYLNQFALLNYRWIETHFKVEQADINQLTNPQKYILDHGGEIFFILENQEVVGTCAMVPHGDHGYELAKMAVAPAAKGRGYGDLLMQTALDWAKQKNAEEVILLSNTILEPAITLYRKHGFIVTQLGPHPDYERCNIEMRFQIRSEGTSR